MDTDSYKIDYLPFDRGADDRIDLLGECCLSDFIVDIESHGSLTVSEL